MSDSTQKNVGRQLMHFPENVEKRHVHGPPGHQIAMHRLIQVGFDFGDPQGVSAQQIGRYNRPGGLLCEGIHRVSFPQTDNARVCVHFENDRMGVCQSAVNL